MKLPRLRVGDAAPWVMLALALALVGGLAYRCYESVDGGGSSSTVEATFTPSEVERAAKRLCALRVWETWNRALWEHEKDPNLALEGAYTATYFACLQDCWGWSWESVIALRQGDLMELGDRCLRWTGIELPY